MVCTERSGQPLAALPVGARNATAPVTPSPSLAVESMPCFCWKVEVRGPGRPRVSPPCAGQSDLGAVGLPGDAARSPASLPSSLFHGGPSVGAILVAVGGLQVGPTRLERNERAAPQRGGGPGFPLAPASAARAVSAYLVGHRESKGRGPENVSGTVGDGSKQTSRGTRVNVERRPTVAIQPYVCVFHGRPARLWRRQSEEDLTTATWAWQLRTWWEEPL